MKTTPNRYIPGTSVFALLAFVLGATLCGAQTIVETFDNGYPGSSGDGGTTAWLTPTSSDYTVSGSIGNFTPVVSGGGNYLVGTVSVTTASAAKAVMFRRAFDGSAATGVDSSAAYTVSFDFRGDDTFGSDSESYQVFSTANSSASTTGGDTTWGLRIYGGMWRVLSGNGAGGETWVNLVPYTVGITYSFTVSMDPTAKSWIVSVTYDGQTESSGLLTTRSSVATGSNYLYFGVVESGAVKDYSFSLDNVVVSSSIPEPAHAAFLAGLGIRPGVGAGWARLDAWTSGGGKSSMTM